MTHLSPHLTQPHRCLTFWDYVWLFLRKWAGRLLTMGFWLAVGRSIRYITEASECPHFLKLIGVAVFLMVSTEALLVRVAIAIVRGARG